jgi:type IV pilus assembly protein PilQ
MAKVGGKKGLHQLLYLKRMRSNMKIKQGGWNMGSLNYWALLRIFILGCFFFGQASAAGIQSLNNVDFNVLSGGRVQLVFELSEKAVKPKVFQMSNPARIVLDFPETKSALAQKKNIINQAGINSFFAVEAGGRLRVVVNLREKLTYTVKLQGKKTRLIFKQIEAEKKIPIASNDVENSQVSIAKQEVKKIDFRRGTKGEGRILISLSNKDTLVKTQQKSGKIELRFINTRLPANYAKRMDVIDFATPVSIIGATQSGADVKVLITPIDIEYSYSVFQADGLLTVKVREITLEESKAKKAAYKGERLTLDFHDIEVRNALKILAEISGENIIVDDAVSGNVTLQLNDVHWDHAFALILKLKGLAKRQVDNVVLVAPMEKIRKLEEEEIEAKKVKERLEPLLTEYIQINYAQAESFKDILEGNSTRARGGCALMALELGGGSGSGSSGGGLNIGGDNNDDDEENTLLSRRGTAIVDSRTNTLIIKDTATQLEEIRKMLALLDVPVRQVLIEARIVIAEEGFQQDLGVKFGATYLGGDGAQTGFGIGGSTGGSTAINGFDPVSSVVTGLAAANPYGALGMTLVSGADYVLNLEISAMQDDRKAEFVSNPKILTSDRCIARIEQGEEIPYQTTSQDGTTTIFKDASIVLEVIPQITPGGSVIMKIKITKDSRGEQTPDGLAINKREINTSVHIKNGETIVLGGVYEGDTLHIVESVPWFAELPLVGWMFRRNIEGNSKRELLIFITPKVVKDVMRTQS